MQKRFKGNVFTGIKHEPKLVHISSDFRNYKLLRLKINTENRRKQKQNKTKKKVRCIHMINQELLWGLLNVTHIQKQNCNVQTCVIATVFVSVEIHNSSGILSLTLQ